MAFELPKLPYAYNALEQVIDEQTMTIHHTKHHQAYIDKLNDAVKDTPFAEKSIEELLGSLDQLPEDLRTPVRNNGGGHWNHSKFWEWMRAPQEGNTPSGKLTEAINGSFESFDKFKEEFAKAGVGRFGSGWAWLVIKDKKLAIISTPNQDNPIMDPSVVGASAGTPVLGLDVWEHAYYLKYQNKRADYITAWWNIVNWEKVEENYLKAQEA